jgi:predicted GNAT family acetyltransferase
MDVASGVAYCDGMPIPPDLSITLEVVGPGRGRYVARTAAGGDSELTFAHHPGAIKVDHTGVPTALEGKGIALALVARAVSDARALGLKIIPACSYVRAQALRHPEWADVVSN